MKAFTAAGSIAMLACAVSAMAGDRLVLREETPETGTNLTRVAITWPVPMDARYDELTDAQKSMVRADYETLGPRDEPAYPAQGMEPLLRDLARTRNSYLVQDGMIHLAVRVDATGHPRGVAVLQAPNDLMARAVATALMHTKFKPALCNGAPCDSDYSFRHDFRHRVHMNHIEDLQPVAARDRRLFLP